MWNLLTDLLEVVTIEWHWLALFLTRRVHAAWVRRGSPLHGRWFELLCAVSP